MVRDVALQLYFNIAGSNHLLSDLLVMVAADT